MKYKSGERRRAAEYEKALVQWWKDNKTFEKSVEQRPEDDAYVFYDGPPFITGMPHHGTLLSSIVKDAVPRFWTMRGKRVERRWGWDCHGLPAENFVEKQLGITDRRKIGSKWSLEDYIVKARESMVANSETWESTIDRIGRWVDFKGAYRTMDKNFMESVWWAFKTLYDAGKIYEGRKVLMYDTKFATPVSKSEVTMDNDAYQTVTDPSAYVKFRLTDKANEKLRRLVEDEIREEDENEVGRGGVREGISPNSSIFMLAWTTTPWTLPGNMALAVNPEMRYVICCDEDGNVLVVGEFYFEKAENWTKIAEFAGEKLIGLTYEPICDMGFAFSQAISLSKSSSTQSQDHKSSSFRASDSPRTRSEISANQEKMFGKQKDTWTVLGGDFVSDVDGTGIVHIAPAYGEDDYKLAQAHEVDFVDVLDEYGYYLPEVAKKLHELGVRDTDERGIEIWAGNKFIAKCLEEKGIVWKIEYIKHEYPFNPRSKQRIMYRAFPSWFFDVQGQKELMIQQNENINWFPAYLKHGRFEKNIEQAPDWNLSRDRFWATAMPVWKGEPVFDDEVKSVHPVKVFGSYAELAEFTKCDKDDKGIYLEDYHRPWVDQISFDAWVSEDGEIKPYFALTKEDEAAKEWDEYHFERIDKVLDCWFESGSMPFAQLHYPFENKEKFERNYPADFIVEYVGQVRAWFYYVHVVNTALAEVGGFGEKAKERAEKNAYKNVITTGTLAGNDGRKMSKSLGNYTDPNELMDKFSADALRFLLLSSPVLSGEDFALTDKDVSDVNRKLAMIWNVYDFFTMYAEVDGWELPELPGHWDDGLKNPLDVWIIARLHELRKEVLEGMEEYNIPKALAGVLPFVDDLSNWFVRRSRRRFWKSEDDGDKKEAYWTLWKVLGNLAKIMAPFTPFLAEELWQNMVGDWSPEKSVHLQEFPVNAELDQEMQTVLAQMKRVREIINEALAMRMSKNEGEQQIKVRQPLSLLTYAGEKLPAWAEEMIRDEVNVKQVEHGDTLMLDKTLTDELKREGFVRELIRAVQATRKKAGLNVDDRIKLSVTCEVPEEWREELKRETLAEELTFNQNYAHDEVVKVEGENYTVSLEKSS